MKNLIFNPLFVVVLLGGVYLSSCRKGDDNPASNSINWTQFQTDNANSGISKATPPRDIPQEIWSIDIDDSPTLSTLLYNEKLYFGSGYTFYCVDKKTGNTKWEYESTGYIVSEHAIYDDILFFGDDGGNFYVVDAETGKLNWGKKLNGDIRSCPIKVGNNIIINDEDGIMYSFNIASGELIWAIDEGLEAKCPAYKDGIIYHVSYDAPSPLRSSLKAIDAATGDLVWRIDLEVPHMANCSPTIKGDKVIIGGAGYVYCIDIETRDISWVYKVDKRIIFDNSANIIDNKVIIGSHSLASLVAKPYLAALNFETGELIWKSRIEDKRFQIASSTVTGSNGVIIGVVNTFGLIAYDLSDGKILWNTGTQSGSGRGSIVLDGEIIYYGVGTRKMQALK